MRSTLRVASIAIAGIAIAAPAIAAERDPGWYGDLRGGITMPDQMNSTSSAATMSIDPKTGWSIQGAVGYRFSSPIRLALQAGYQHNRINGTFQENVIPIVPCGTGTPCLDRNINGHINAPSLFAMAFYDIPMSERLTLSLGGGVGVQRTDILARTTGRFSNGTSSPFTLIDNDHAAFAQRASAELAYNLGTRTDLTVGYTFTHADTKNFQGQGAVVPFTFRDSMATHAVTAGVKLAF